MQVLIPYAMTVATGANVNGCLLLVGGTRDQSRAMFARKHPDILPADYPPSVDQFHYLPTPTPPTIPGAPHTAITLAVLGQANTKFDQDTIRKEQQTAALITLKSDIFHALPPSRQESFLNMMIAAGNVGGAPEASFSEIMNEVIAATKPDDASTRATKALLRPVYVTETDPRTVNNQIASAINILGQATGTKLNADAEMEVANDTFGRCPIMDDEINLYYKDVQDENMRNFKDLAPRLQAAYERRAKMGKSSRIALGYGASATHASALQAAVSPAQWTAIMTILNVTPAGTANAAMAPSPALPPSVPRPRPPHPLAGQPRPYCWTHGYCGHIGAICNTRAAGHQPAATGTNKMGGSVLGKPTY